MGDVLQSYCKNNKIVMVYKLNELGNAVAYYDKQRDVTQVILAEANKQFVGVNNKSLK